MRQSKFNKSWLTNSSKKQDSHRTSSLPTMNIKNIVFTTTKCIRVSWISPQFTGSMKQDKPFVKNNSKNKPKTCSYLGKIDL